LQYGSRLKKLGLVDHFRARVDGIFIAKAATLSQIRVGTAIAVTIRFQPHDIIVFVPTGLSLFDEIPTIRHWHFVRIAFHPIPQWPL
jgi:hypothetical protein